MKDKLSAIKRHFAEHESDYKSLAAGIAVGMFGTTLGYILGKRTMAADLQIMSARDYINDETGEISPLYISHRNGTTSVLRRRQDV
jgi:hypothetical protein